MALFASKSAAQTTIGVVQGHTDSGLTIQERRGKDFYLRGVGSSERVITARLGEIDTPATTLSCAGCHGYEGRGKTEGGISPGNLTWQYLTKPYGHTHTNERKHPAFTESAFIRAVANGIDPAGNDLAVAMPRYSMSPGEMADLIAYLKRIEDDRDPGLTETSISVGTLLASTGQLAEPSRAIKEVLAAYFDDLNSRGGIYNRRIELQVGDVVTDKALTIANAKRLIEDQQPFAFVAGVSAGTDREVAALFKDVGAPYIGLATLHPQTDFPLNRYMFYLLPGVKDQLRALVNFAASKPELLKSQIAIVHPDNSVEAEAAKTVEEQSRSRGFKQVSKIVYSRERFNAAQLVVALKQQGTGIIFFLGTADEQKSFIEQAEGIQWTPTIFLIGSTTGRELLNFVPMNFKDKLFISYATAPSDVAPAGIAEYRALIEKYKLTPRHTVAQLSALAAAKIFVEGLKLVGRDVSREKLVTALEGLYEFDTSMTPRVTFGPNRRTGAQGAYVVSVDPEKKTFIPASGWIKSN